MRSFKLRLLAVLTLRCQALPAPTRLSVEVWAAADAACLDERFRLFLRQSGRVDQEYGRNRCNCRWDRAFFRFLLVKEHDVGLMAWGQDSMRK